MSETRPLADVLRQAFEASGLDAGPAAEREPLTAGLLEAALRFTAAEAPHLIVGLVWTISLRPELVKTLHDVAVDTRELFELEGLDPVLLEIAGGYADALRALGRRRPSKEEWGTIGVGALGIHGRAEAGDELIRPPVAPPAQSADRLGAVAAEVAAVRPDLLPALLACFVRSPASRLALRAYVPSAEEMRGLADLAPLAEADEESGSAPRVPRRPSSASSRR